MRRTLHCVFALACCAPWALAASLPTSHLVVVLDFKGSHTDGSIAEMEHEAQQIVKDAGVHLDWRTAEEASAQQVFSDLVVVKIKGDCKIGPVREAGEETVFPDGPLAFTYKSGGEVQPFGEVACDRVAAFVRSAMGVTDYANADMLLGRALGRVLAHELVHMMTKSDGHGRAGVAKPALSSKQLIAKSLLLNSADVERLKQKSAGSATAQ